MLLIVLKVVEHPKLLAGLLNLSSVVDTLSSFKHDQHSKTRLVSKESLDIGDAFVHVDTQPRPRPQLHIAASSSIGRCWNQLLNRHLFENRLRNHSPQPASKRYRWHVPAGFFRYLLISQQSLAISSIQGYSRI